MLRNLWGVVCFVALCASLISVANLARANDTEVASLPREDNPSYNSLNWLQNWLAGPLPGQPSSVRIERRVGRNQIPPAPIQRPTIRQYRPADQPASGASPSLAEPPAQPFFQIPGLHLGVDVVVSTGKTDWNHDASNASATLGNPSSELIYEEVSTMALEFSGFIPFEDNYFIRGNFGVGMAFGGDGNLRDDDFLAGQVLFSSTDSAILNTDLLYLTLDAGKKVFEAPDGSLSLSVFAGYQFWRETYEAFGLFNRLTGQNSQPDSLNVITNEVEWNSLRLGAIAAYKPDERTEWVLDFALVPYTSMRNEDSHLLRTSSSSLGPVPNVIMEGTGYGFEGSVGVNYLITLNLSAVAGLRYWLLMSDGDITTRANTTSPSTFVLNDLDSVRYGANLGLRYSF